MRSLPNGSTPPPHAIDAPDVELLRLATLSAGLHRRGEVFTRYALAPGSTRSHVNGLANVGERPETSSSSPASPVPAGFSRTSPPLPFAVTSRPPANRLRSWSIHFNKT